MSKPQKGKVPMRRLVIPLGPGMSVVVSQRLTKKQAEKLLSKAHVLMVNRGKLRVISASQWFRNLDKRINRALHNSAPLSPVAPSPERPGQTFPGTSTQKPSASTTRSTAASKKRRH